MICEVCISNFVEDMHFTKVLTNVVIEFQLNATSIYHGYFGVCRDAILSISEGYDSRNTLAAFA